MLFATGPLGRHHRWLGCRSRARIGWAAGPMFICLGLETQHKISRDAEARNDNQNTVGQQWGGSLGLGVLKPFPQHGAWGTFKAESQDHFLQVGLLGGLVTMHKERLKWPLPTHPLSLLPLGPGWHWPEQEGKNDLVESRCSPQALCSLGIKKCPLLWAVSVFPSNWELVRRKNVCPEYVFC